MEVSGTTSPTSKVHREGSVKEIEASRMSGGLFIKFSFNTSFVGSLTFFYYFYPVLDCGTLTAQPFTGMFPRYMNNLRSSCKLIVDLIAVITSTQYEVILGHSQNIRKWPADISAQLLQHCPVCARMVGLFLTFGVSNVRILQSEVAEVLTFCT